MATVKSYTDLSQSKVIAKILPLDSANLWWSRACIINDESLHIGYSVEPINLSQFKYTDEDIPCWSLSALLNVLPYPTLYQQGDGAWGLDAWVEQVKPYSVKNAICEVDACVEMIIKLHEQKLL